MIADCKWMTMHYIYQTSKYCHSETVTFEDILQI